MREQLNNNPLAQLAVVAVLLLAGGFFLISTMGGGGEGGEEAATSSVTATAETEPLATTGEVGETVEPEGAVASTAGVEAAPPPSVEPPRAVVEAWESGATVAILFVRDGGIDDDLVRGTAANLGAFPGVASFVVPAKRIARYAALTGGLDVDRVPALVVLAPRQVSGGVPTASVSYGFQSAAAVRQAVIDAGYKGPTLEYHP